MRTTQILFACLATAVAVSGAGAEPPPVFDRLWGQGGDQLGQFDQVGGISIDDSGHVYVADGIWSRVQVFDSNGTFLFYWGGRGTGPGTFNGTADVAVSPSDSVYVLDGNSRRIQEFTPTGDFVRWWRFSGDSGSIAVGSDGSVFVADIHNSRIKKFSASGDSLLTWGRRGNAPGAFYGHLSVATDRQGFVYVGDDYRVHKFTENGSFLFAWNALEAWDLAANSHGQVFVVGGLNAPDARKYDADGTLLSQWNAGGGRQFWDPRGIEVDASGAIYVVDQRLNCIFKFLPAVAVQPSQWTDVKHLFGGRRAP